MPIINGQGRVAVRVSGITPAPSSSYLLDTYGGAAAAYSLRKLSTSYSGSAIRVRRSSDNTEQNIGFDGSGNLDTTALTAFVGAGNNGFVTTWYDQSGNGRNVVQTNAAQQPQLITSGTINILNTKPALKFNGNQYLLHNNTSVLNIQDCISTFSTANFTSNGGFFGHIMSKGYGAEGAYSLGQSGYNNILQLWMESQNITSPNTYSRNTQYLFSNINQTGTNGIKLYLNNSINIQATTTQDLIGTNSYKFTIGRNDREATYYLIGNIQEIICYPSNQSSNRTSIESNINSYYSIY